MHEYHGRAATQPALSQRPAPPTIPPAKDPDQVRAEQMISDHLACKTEFFDESGKLTVVFHHHDAEVRDGILERLGAGGCERYTWMKEAGFSPLHVEPLVGPDSMVIGIK